MGKTSVERSSVQIVDKHSGRYITSRITFVILSPILIKYVENDDVRSAHITVKIRTVFISLLAQFGDDTTQKKN